MSIYFKSFFCSRTRGLGRRRGRHHRMRPRGGGCLLGGLLRGTARGRCGGRGASAGRALVRGRGASAPAQVHARAQVHKTAANFF